MAPRSADQMVHHLVAQTALLSVDRLAQPTVDWTAQQMVGQTVPQRDMHWVAHSDLC